MLPTHIRFSSSDSSEESSDEDVPVSVDKPKAVSAGPKATPNRAEDQQEASPRIRKNQKSPKQKQAPKRSPKQSEDKQEQDQTKQWNEFYEPTKEEQLNAVSRNRAFLIQVNSF